jgi:Mce-associated membrane protein
VSPRRRIQPGEEPLLKVPKPTLWSRLPWRPTLPAQWWKPSRTWALPATATAAVLLTALAITTSAVAFHKQQKQHEKTMEQADVLGYVKAFMTGFTTLDPFHANAYYDRVIVNATGDFAKQLHERQNDILVQIAQTEPTKGTALAAGVERWNDDGSANVMVATDVSSKTPDGKQKIQTTNRWVLTAQREGNQWKISSLQQVI